MKKYYSILALLVLSCSIAQTKSLEEINPHDILNSIHKKDTNVFIKPRSAKTYSKEFILNDLMQYSPSFYASSTYELYNSRKDSIMNLGALSGQEKDEILKEIKGDIFFEIGDFLTPKDLHEFSKSASKKTMKWKSEMLNTNIKLSNDYNSCAVSLPLFNKKKNKALIFRKCRSSEDFEILERNEKGGWDFVFSSNIILYNNVKP